MRKKGEATLSPSEGTGGRGQARGDGGDSLWCLPNENHEGAMYISVLFLVRITKLLFTEKKKPQKTMTTKQAHRWFLHFPILNSNSECQPADLQQDRN